MADIQNFSVTALGNGRFRVEGIVDPDEGDSVDLTGINAVILPDHLNELMTTEELQAIYDNIAQMVLLKKAGIS